MRLSVIALLLSLLLATASGPSSAFVTGGVSGDGYCILTNNIHGAACATGPCSTARPMLLVGQGPPGTSYRFSCGAVVLECTSTAEQPVCGLDGTGLPGGEGTGMLMVRGAHAFAAALNLGP